MKYEVEKWRRTLEFIKEENLILKNRLAEMIHLNSNKHLFSQAEDFQNYFLNNDVIIAMLKSDILKHEQLMSKGTEDEASYKKIQKSQQILRGDMDKLEKSFSKLDIDFNTFMDDATTEYQLMV